LFVINESTAIASAIIIADRRRKEGFLLADLAALVEQVRTRSLPLREEHI